MPGQNEDDSRYKAFGLSAFIIFLLTAIISMLLAMDIESYSVPLTVVSVSSLCIAVVCCVWVSRDDSEEYSIVDGQEPTGEEIELHDMSVSPPAQENSEGSSKTQDSDIQETLGLKKSNVARQRLSASETLDYLTSSEEESRILETVADVYAGIDSESSSKDGSDEMSTYSAEEQRKIFRLTQLHHIDSDDTSSGNVVGAEEVLPQATPPDSNDGTDPTKKM